MAAIVIKDLTESIDLDRQAMVAITGGSRLRVQQTFPRRALSSGTRIIDYPTTVAFDPLANAGRQATQKAPTT